jgi:outer membrane protein TolC
LVVTAEARLHYAEADLKTAEALDQLARDRERAGLSPEVDTLRAHVELQAREEHVIEARNALAKRRITLLRLLGFDIRQSIRLTSKEVYKPGPVMPLETAYKQALGSRQDYRSEQQQLKSAEQAKRAAEYERAPKIGVAADYGALGTAPGNAVPVWTAGVVLRVPVFEGGRIKAEIAEADATLRQKQAELENTRTRIEQEVENALLDLNASKQQVAVAQAALGYANRALTQSKDRFSAGATNNIEVIQAQESLASANEQWVNSLYAYNIGKVLLARATGTAEANVKSFLDQGGPHK